MVVQTSNVAMAAESVRSVVKYESVSYSRGWGETLLTAGNISAAPTATDGAQTDETETDKSELYELESAGGHGQLFGVDTGQAEKRGYLTLLEALMPNQKAEIRSLEEILDTMGRYRPKTVTPADLFKQIMEQMRIKAENLLGICYGNTAGDGGAGNYTIGEKYVNMNITKYERTTESTSFTSQGRVTTADGRSMEFGISFSQSRTFEEATNVEINFKQLYLTDPLVINLDTDTADISDQDFYFDIDCDGEEDNISLLGKMSGFLALDRNEDGVINDGSELFGAKTGNGFKELAVFDLDGNGWIDENDPVFNRLRIWNRDADGTDRLVALGVRGIGAIYLGNLDTPVTAVNSNGDVSAVVRKSGVYLREDGTAGTIQHVDIAKILTDIE